MDVMPLVPETKMADVRILIIGQENHVRNLNFLPRFWSLLHDKNFQ